MVSLFLGLFLFMILKKIILKKALSYKFSIVKINPPSKNILNIIKKERYPFHLNTRKFKEKIKKLKNKTNISNFIFILRSLDFSLWKYPKNWHYKNEKGFFALMERTIDLFSKKNNDFKEFKKLISPKEDLKLARLRYKIFRSSVEFLNKYDNDFFNYFRENKEPKNFCLNLFQLKKFQDRYKNLYFLKPNQLLYLELAVGKNLEKKLSEKLEELTIFADWRIIQLFLNLGLIELPPPYLKKIKNKQTIKNHSVLENELRLGAIFLGEKLAQKTGLPSFIVDGILWSVARTKNLKIPYPRVLTIFY